LPLEEGVVTGTSVGRMVGAKVGAEVGAEVETEVGEGVDSTHLAPSKQKSIGQMHRSM